MLGIFLPFALCFYVCNSSQDPYNPPGNPSLFDANTLTSAGNLWNLGGTIPSERIHQSIVSTKDYIIVYGGYSTNGTHLGDMNLFHLKSQTWSGPILRKECCNTPGDEIDLIGADQEWDLPYLKQGFEGDYPSARAEHSACTLEEAMSSSSSTITSKGLEAEEEPVQQDYTTTDRADVMYLFGGTTEDYGYMNDMYQFNTRSLKWKIVDAVDGTSGIPSRRAGHSVAADKDGAVFYIFGGRTSNKNNNAASDRTVGLGDVWMYTATTNCWILLSNSASAGTGPANRQHASMSLIGKDKLYIFGGIDPSSSVAFNDVWIFHIATRAWERLFRSTGSSYGFIPPPISNAHMIPFQALAATAGGDNQYNANDQEPCTADEENCRLEFLVYGGVGGGGACGDNECSSLQTVIGQIYRFSITEQNWIAPHSITGGLKYATSEQFAADSTAWSYARISSEQYTKQGIKQPDQANEINDRGKLIKVFALEKVVIMPDRKLMYEFGGMQVVQTVEDPAPQSPDDIPSATSSSSDPPGTNINAELQAQFMDSSGGLLGESLWDLKTGENLRDRVDLPTNNRWVFSDAFPQAAGFDALFGESVIRNGSTVEFKFLRAFRVYGLAPTDIVLLEESVF